MDIRCDQETRHASARARARAVHETAPPRSHSTPGNITLAHTRGAHAAPRRRLRERDAPRPRGRINRHEPRSAQRGCVARSAACTPTHPHTHTHVRAAEGHALSSHHGTALPPPAAAAPRRTNDARAQRREVVRPCPRARAARTHKHSRTHIRHRRSTRARRGRAHGTTPAPGFAAAAAAARAVTCDASATRHVARTARAPPPIAT